MKVGISISSPHEAPGADGASWMIERAAAANAARLASLSVGDGHITDVPYFQNTPILGRLLAEWDERPAGCFFVLPLWHPVLVAEQVATLAAIHEGTFVVQTGVGGRRHEFAGMGVERSGRAALADESIGVIKALLAGETVSSELFGIEEASMGLLPAGPVEWWIGGGETTDLVRPARSGDAWYTSPYATVDELADPIRRYQDNCAAHDRPPRVIVRRDVLVLDDAAAAESHARRLLAEGYRGLDRSRVVVGDVDQVLGQLAELEAIGVDQVVMRCMAVPQFVAIEIIEAMGDINRRLEIDLR